MARFVMIVSIVVIFVSCMDATSGGPPNEQTIEEDRIRTSLRFIVNHPLNKDRPASFLLRPPLTGEEAFSTLLPVLDIIDSSHVKQLMQLYAATGGLNISGTNGFSLNDIWLIPGYYLMSLEEAVDILTTMKRISNVWNPTWLPLFSSRAGDFIVFDFGNGRIFEIFTKDSLGREVAVSIDDFLQHLAHNFKSGRVFIREDGLMDEIMADNGVVNEGEKRAEKSQRNFNLPADQVFDRIYMARSVKNTPISEMNVKKDLEQPNLVFNCNNMPNVCQNIQNAINNNNKPRLLQRITDLNQIRRNRAAACGNTKCSAGQSCDEYPFASTSQGGAGATVMCVPARENSSQGGQLNAFYNANGVVNLSWFLQSYP